MKKTLYILIGLKGSGKTYIGQLVDRKTDISFLRIEDIWLSLKPSENGWKKVEDTIDQNFEKCDKIMIENLGAGEDFRQFRKSLNSKYDLKTIQIKTDRNTCLDRVKNRDKQNHISVSDEKVEEYNKIASKVVLKWDLVIDNNGPALEKDIVETIQKL